MWLINYSFFKERLYICKALKDDYETEKGFLVPQHSFRMAIFFNCNYQRKIITDGFGFINKQIIICISHRIPFLLISCHTVSNPDIPLKKYFSVSVSDRAGIMVQVVPVDSLVSHTHVFNNQPPNPSTASEVSPSLNK